MAYTMKQMYYVQLGLLCMAVPLFSFLLGGMLYEKATGKPLIKGYPLRSTQTSQPVNQRAYVPYDIDIDGNGTVDYRYMIGKDRELYFQVHQGKKLGIEEVIHD